VIENDDVRSQDERQAECFIPTRGLAHDAERWLGRKESAYAVANLRVVIDQEDPSRGRGLSGSQRGTR